MAESLSALFAAHKPVKPQFKVVQASTESGKKLSGNETAGAGKKREPDPREGRTVFVGNIPTTCSRKQIKQLFRQYGTVETIRFRSMTVEAGKLPPHAARKAHKQIGGSNLNAYVVLDSAENAEQSLEMNGTVLDGRHLRVDLAGASKEHEHKRCVFVGNLPFSADEEGLRELFGDCGEVEAVRVVRDSKTGVGKGFGFVTFREQSGVLFALKQNKKLELEGRAVRVFKSKDVQPPRKKLPRQQPKFAGLQAKKPTQKRKLVARNKTQQKGGSARERTERDSTADRKTKSLKTNSQHHRGRKTQQKGGSARERTEKHSTADRKTTRTKNQHNKERTMS